MSTAASDKPFLFLGDSLTAFGPWSQLFPELSNAVNRGIPGNTARDVRGRLEAVLALEPRAVVFMIGTNDLIQGRAVPDILADVRSIVTRFLAAFARLSLLAVLPVREADDLVFAGFNARALVYNVELRALAAELSVPFVDFRAAFTDAAGELSAELTYDGVHLQPLAYALWSRELRKHVDFA